MKHNGEKVRRKITLFSIHCISHFFILFISFKKKKTSVFSFGAKVMSLLVNDVPWVGLWLSQKTLRRLAKLICSGWKTTLTTSAWPVLPAKYNICEQMNDTERYSVFSWWIIPPNSLLMKKHLDFFSFHIFHSSIKSFFWFGPGLFHCIAQCEWRLRWPQFGTEAMWCYGQDHPQNCF